MPMHSLLRASLLLCMAIVLLPVQLLLAEPDRLSDLPLAPRRELTAADDWLIADSTYEAHVYRSDDGRSLVLDNGLVRRTIRLEPNAATIAVDDLRTGASLLRSVRPEGEMTLDGRACRVGGLLGQPDQAYLSPAWADGLTDDPDAFAFTGFQVVAPEMPFAWKRTRHAEGRPWPPKGAAVLLHFRCHDDAHAGVAVTVRHEIYDGIPVLAKSVAIANNGDKPIDVDALKVEILAAVEGESVVDQRDPLAWRRPPIQVLSDYMFRGMDLVTANQVARWDFDPTYTTQVSSSDKTPCLLVCQAPRGPGRRLQPGETLSSFRVFLVLQDSDDRERRGLALRRTWRTIAPWTTENPLMMHFLGSTSEEFRAAIDQCAAVGFEMIIFSFGSSLNMENSDPAYLAKLKVDVDYAHAHGVQVGGYSLFSARSIGPEDDVIDPATGKPGGANFGSAGCFGSRWGQAYEQKIKHFFEATGFDLLEHDGPYPGDFCASTTHPGHRGLEDSQWTQWEASKRLYSWCREHGVYVNQPDYYFLCGGSKTGMGYREATWSLPRAQQVIHARQQIFDGTWTKSGTMGWMFTPLVQYHGGGAAATIEPLHEHLDAYQSHLANNLGAGVQACYRGPRLYDTEETKSLVMRWVAWFKQHRAILESDIIHARRADGRDVDFIVHVNPRLPEKALAAIYNPLDEPATRTLRLPLYYTGLTTTARIRQEDGEQREFPLDRAGRATVDVTVPARGMTWLVVE